MRRRPTPPTTTAAPTPGPADQLAPSSSYDWARFGRHRFRAPAAVVVDNPLPPAGLGWMATVWPDPGAPAAGAGCSGSPTPPTGGGG